MQFYEPGFINAACIYYDRSTYSTHWAIVVAIEIRQWYVFEGLGNGLQTLVFLDTQNGWANHFQVAQPNGIIQALMIWHDLTSIYINYLNALIVWCYYISFFRIYLYLYIYI